MELIKANPYISNGNRSFNYSNSQSLLIKYTKNLANIVLFLRFLISKKEQYFNSRIFFVNVEKVFN